jgi:DNA-binding NtrC family response regulator
VADVIAFPTAYGHRHTVLVVDDEPAIRAVLCEFLRECGFHPLAVESGDEAVRMIQAGVAIDLVFSDVRMPGAIDGYGLARWIMEHRSDLPVILVTGDLGKVNAATELCGAETMAKPYDFETAVHKIRDTISRHANRAG